MDINGLEIHELANIVPLAVPMEQLALEDNIKRFGQKIPIVLYRSKIVDGRCRAIACANLGIEVRIENLPNNMSLKAVEEKVEALNIRRNLTATQKAIVAFRHWENNKGFKQKSVCKSWGVNEQQFAAVKWLQNIKPNYVSILFNGGKVRLNDAKQSGSIQTVAKYVKSKIENNIYKNNAWTPEGDIITEKGKDFYNDKIKEIGGIDDPLFNTDDIKNIIIELANMKFPL